MPERRIGKFELLDKLGHGGMGVVYRARDVRLDRLVALKLMQPDRSLDESSRQRFLRECRAVASLNHPNIATLYEADETGDGTLYFAAELVEGETLSAEIERGPVPLDRALAYGLQLADALAAAHGRDIVHRDIKAANVMTTPAGRVKVLDFGLARLGRAREIAAPEAVTVAADQTAVIDRSVAGSVVGTPGNMAPEQISGLPAGPPADIFATGIVLYQLVTNVHPFGGDSLQEKFWKALHDDPPPVSEINRRVPASLAAVIAKCLQKDPADRYQNGAELVAALSGIRLDSRARALKWGAIAAAVATLSVGLWWSQRDTLAFAREDRILIADVVNETSESVFSGALGTALEVDLRQSQYALVVGRREVVEALQLTRRTPETPLDLDTALELARWVGAKAVLAPSIAQVGETFRLEAVLYATESGSPVDSVIVMAAGRDAVLQTAVDELTAGVRERLGESLAQIEQADAPVVKVTTASWDALEAVRLGSQAVDESRMPEAAAFFEEALVRDPEFAAAKGQLGLIFIQFLNQPERGKELLAEAAAASDRLTDYERLMLKALVTQYVDGDLTAALDEFEAASDMFPERTEPYRNRGIILRTLGRYEEAAGMFFESHTRAPKSAGPLELLWFVQVGPLRQPVAGEKTARDLLELRPDNPDYQHMVAWTLVARKRFADALAELESILAEHPDHVRSRINRAHLVFRLGDNTRAVSLYREVLEGARAGELQQDAGVAAFWLAMALQAAGQADEAEALLAAGLDVASDPGPGAQSAFRQFRAAVRTQIQAARGRTIEARRELNAVLVPEQDVAAPITVSSALAFLGDRDRALEILEPALKLQWDPYYCLILPEFLPLWDDPRFGALFTVDEPDPTGGLEG